MAINDIVQTIAEARVDARSLSEFVFKPTGFKVTRRLALPIDTLQFYIDRFDATKAISDAYVATIPSIVNDAINNTAVEGGVLADTFVTVTSNLPNSVARNLRDINSESVSIHTFGECGKGNEDTAVWNLAMKTLSELAKADGKPRVLRLIAGKTYILKLGEIRPLVDIACADGLATLKRVDVPVGTAESVAKWWRILDSNIKQNEWVTYADFAHRTNIKNIIFDGNYNNSQWTRNSYNQEQASCLFLRGRVYPTVADINKRTKFRLDNIHFKNSVSDGLHCSLNTDVVATNCFAEHCFRGGLVITGGNSIIKASNWTTNDARFDIEIDGAGTAGSKTSYVYIRDYYQDEDGGADNEFMGGIDISTVGQNGVLDMDNVNIYTQPLNWFMGSLALGVSKAEGYNIRNSVFTVRNSEVYNPIAGELDNVTFRVDNRDPLVPTGGLRVYMQYVGYKQEKTTDLVFNNIKFELLDKTPERALKKPLFEIASQEADSKTRLKIINSDLSNIIDDVAVIDAQNGGRVYIDNVKVDTPTPLRGSGVNGTGELAGKRALILTLGKIDFGSNVTVFSAFNSKNGNHPDGNPYLSSVEFLPNFRLPQSINQNKPIAGSTGLFTTHKGVRVIDGSLPPTSTTQGFKEDIYKLQDKEVGKPYEWVATISKINDSVAAKWRATKWLTGSFTTATLPALTAFDVGVQNIDTTLNKVVTWSGTAWI